MDRNKSIDGLSPRRPGGVASSVSPNLVNSKAPVGTSGVDRPIKTTKTSNSTRAKTARAAIRTKPAKPPVKPRTTIATTRPKTTTRKVTKKTSVKKPRQGQKVPAGVVATAPAQATPKKVTPIEVLNLDETAKAEPQLVQTEAKAEPKPLSAAEDFLKPVQAFDFDEQSGKLTVSADPTKKGKKMKKTKKPLSKKKKIIIWLTVGILGLLIAAVVGFVIWGNDILAKITGGQGNVFDLLFEDQYEKLKTDENGRTNILAFGTSGYDMEGTEGYGVHDGAQLTDSIMVISLDQETGDVAMLSLPRDLKVSYTCTGTGKINEVFWCANQENDNEQAGAEALMSEVGDILDIDVHYFAHINWGSLVQIVNTLDGITVTLDEDVADYYYTGAVFEAGVPYTINGDQALGLARARHGTTSGDFSRGASQQKILFGIKDKVFEKHLSISDMINLANTLGDNLRTNFSVGELKSMAHLVSEFGADTMRQVSLVEPENYMTTGTINGISYVLPVGGAGNYSRIQKYVAKMFSSDPRSYEDSSILVLNATETPGLASAEQKELEDEKYANVDADDAPVGDYADGYSVYALTDSAPGTKKMLEEKYQQSAKGIGELPAGISQDYDFVVIINTQE